MSQKCSFDVESKLKIVNITDFTGMGKSGSGHAQCSETERPQTLPRKSFTKMQCATKTNFRWQLNVQSETSTWTMELNQFNNKNSVFSLP